jgi:hypothetical protein
MPYYEEHCIEARYTNMLLSMFFSHDTAKPKAKAKAKASPYAKLKGKAHQIKDFVYPLLEAWQQYMGTSDQDQMVELVLERSIEINRILDENRQHWKLPPLVAEQYATAVFDFLALYTALGNYYMQPEHRLPIFNFVPKFHYLAHSGLSGGQLNPALAWCYAGEDFMQIMGKLAARTLNSLSPAGSMRKVCNNKTNC